jgi:hypothetical protein
MEAPREVRGVSELLKRHVPDARHDTHVQDDVAAVGDFDPHLRVRRRRRSHEERHHEHRPALHGAAEQRRQPLARLAWVQPIVGGARVFLVDGADESEVLRARDVVGRTPVQIAARHLLLVELDQLSAGQALCNQLCLLCLGSVTVHHVVWSSERLDLVDPLCELRIHRG